MVPHNNTGSPKSIFTLYMIPIQIIKSGIANKYEERHLEEKAELGALHRNWYWAIGVLYRRSRALMPIVDLESVLFGFRFHPK